MQIQYNPDALDAGQSRGKFIQCGEKAVIELPKADSTALGRIMRRR